MIMNDISLLHVLTCRNIKRTLHFAHTVFLRVLYDLHDEKQLHPLIALVFSFCDGNDL
jgi:hypothetical protein